MSNQYAVSMSLRLIDGVSPSFKAMTANTNRLETAMSRTFKRGNRDMRSMINTAKGFVLGSGIVGGLNNIRSSIGGLVQEWGQFDNASRFAASKFEEVTTGVMTFNDALEQTKKTSREVGGSTMFTAGQVAVAMDNLALSGYSLSQSQASIGKIAQFATLAQMSLEEATEGATGALGAFNLKSKDSKKMGQNFTYLMDVMTNTFTSSRMNLDDLSQAITAGGAAFVTSSQDIETFNTFLFAMAEGGIKSEKAGMRMRAIINRLGAPTKKAASALDQLGVKVADSAGNFLPMLNVMGQFRNGLQGLGTKERGAMIKAVFGERNITGINLILQKSQKELEAYYSKLKNSTGAADAQMKRVQGSMLQRLLILKSAFTEKFFSGMETAQNPLANSLSDLIAAVQGFDMTKINAFIALNLPTTLKTLKESLMELKQPFKSFVKTFSGLVSMFIKLSPLLVPLLGFYVKYRVLMIGLGVAQWAFNAAMAFGNSQLAIGLQLMVLEMATGGKLKAVKYGLTLAQQALNAAMLNNPVGWVVAGIVGLIAVVVLAIKYWDTWGAGLLSWGSIALAVFTKFLGPIGLVIAAVVSLYKNWENIQAAFRDGGIVSGLKSIGLTLAHSLLQPIEWILYGLEKMGIISAERLNDFRKFREGMLGGNESSTSFMTKTERVITKQEARDAQIAASTQLPTAKNFDSNGQFQPAWDNFQVETSGMDAPWDDKAKAQGLNLSGEISMTGDGFRNLGGAEFALNGTEIGVNMGGN